MHLHVLNILLKSFLLCLCSLKYLEVNPLEILNTILAFNIKIPALGRG